MKIKRLERLRESQIQYHRTNQWRLSEGGLYIPHLYTETKQDYLSYWDDVGFILNGRRIIVWWRHPRYVYLNEVEDRSYLEAGENPGDNWLTDGAIKNYKIVGKSRKKLVSYSCREPSTEQSAYYKKRREEQEKLQKEGIDFDVSFSWKWERLNWAMGVSLVAPVEVRNEKELAQVADLSKRLILGKTTLMAEFPGYRYGKKEWLSEIKSGPLSH